MSDAASHRAASEAPISRDGVIRSAKPKLERAIARQPTPVLDASVSDGREIVEYIAAEMSKNANSENELFAQIFTLLKEYQNQKEDWHANNRVASTKLFEAMLQFRKLVGYRQPWDHKAYIWERWGQYSELLGSIIEWDAWSNIHYGYVGLKVGFSRKLLLDCAGIAQAVGSEVPDGWLERYLSGDLSILQALDDPTDQSSIMIGMSAVDVDPADMKAKTLMPYIFADLASISK